MKIAIVVLLALFSGTIHPQSGATEKHLPQKPYQHVKVADQQKCWQRANTRVNAVRKDDKAYAEKNNHKFPENMLAVDYGITELYGVYYDAQSKTCYVAFSKTTTWDSYVVPSACTSILVQCTPLLDSTENLHNVWVEDAFEGKEFAHFIGSESATAVDGKLREFEGETPELCHVNGTTCDSRAAFNRLLCDLIPAFQPVDAVISDR